MHWNGETTRHTVVSSNPYRRGIESANSIRADYDEPDNELGYQVVEWIEDNYPAGSYQYNGNGVPVDKDLGQLAREWAQATGSPAEYAARDALQRLRDEDNQVYSKRKSADIPASPDAQTPQVGEVYDTPTVEVEGPDDGGFADAKAARRTAGFSPGNWREYPGGTGDEWQNADGDWVSTQADYFDALYPDENPSAIWDGEIVYVFDGQGQMVAEKEAYDYAEAQAQGNKLLEKAYRGEAKPDPGQGKFFTTPGKGKLFSNRTASTSLWDQVEAPQHRVAGWEWDHRLSGFVCEGLADFACVCGSNVEAPGHTACQCGKMWNSYTISSATGGLRLVCREVPVRENVLLARRDAT
jgi:hypothetical protein